MTLKQVNQITVYETFDNEITVYHGKNNDQFSAIDRELAIQWITWLDVLRESKTNSLLCSLIQQTETVYLLTSSKKS
jgi:hypothetical protein